LPEQKIAYTLSFRDVIRVLQLVDSAPFQEMQLELDGLALRVVQDKEPRVPAHPAAAHASGPYRAALPESVRKPVADAAIAVAATNAEDKPVLAPLAGIFYRSAFPGEPPFVELGASVEEGDVVGILEVMKLMNHVTAPCSGVVSRICVQNEELVAVGQVLAFIAPERAE